MTIKTLTYINNSPVIVTVKPKPCTCAAYSFPHRLDGGKCRELYNRQAQEEAEWDSYFAQRGITAAQRQEFESGNGEKDFL